MGGSNIPQRDIPRLMDLYQRGVLDLGKLISQRLPLAEVNVAFDALEEGVLARSLVLPGS